MKSTQTVDLGLKPSVGRSAPGLTSRKWLALCVCLALIPFLTAAKRLQNQTKPDITSVVKVVNVLATVRNKKGEIVRNLTKDDFAVDEDDHPQAIKYFVQENDLPLTVGLLVDTSRSQRRVLRAERDASYSFLDHMLHENKDRACVIHFDHEVEMLQDLTPSHKKLEASLQLLDTPDDDGNNSGGYGHGSHGRGGAGTLLYDAVYLGSNEVMKKEQGHKALIILSDGVDHGSKESLESAIEAAQRSDALVYSILFSGDEGHGGGGGWGGPHGGMGGGPMGGGGGHRRNPEEGHPDGKKVLTQISKETGARMFEVSKKLTIEQVYAQIEEELRNQYSIGYTPEGLDAGLGYHKLHLTTKPKDLVVQARDGFYADK
jgi:VWFA-related protein